MGRAAIFGKAGRSGVGGQLPRRGFVRAALGMGLAAPVFVAGAARGRAQEGSPVASPGATPAGGASGITKEPFGTAYEEAVDRYTITNANGMEVKILTYGGIVQSITVPDRDGNPGNVVLGFATLDEYVAGNPYFGCITGRYANRIALGKFTLEGETYQLAINNDPNTLHGGERGFDKYVWAATEVDDDLGRGIQLS